MGFLIALSFMASIVAIGVLFAMWWLGPETVKRDYQAFWNDVRRMFKP